MANIADVNILPSFSPPALPPPQSMNEWNKHFAEASPGPVDVLEDRAKLVRHRTDQIVWREDLTATARHWTEVTSGGRVWGQRATVVI